MSVESCLSYVGLNHTDTFGFDLPHAFIIKVKANALNKLNISVY